MAKDVNHTKFQVQPVDNEDGTLKALTIQRTLRIERVSDTGSTLNRGATSNVGDPIEVPLDRLADLVRELADWPIWYATTLADQRG